MVDGRPAPAPLPPFGIPPFDGYPYLVTRIGHSALRHIALLPADWPRERALDLARRQRNANRLDTCIVLGPRDALYLAAGGTEDHADFVSSGLPVIDRLRLAETFPATAELADRRARLAAFAETYRGKGYIVGDGLEGGVPAGPDDLARLATPGRDGIPAGFRRCPTCGRFAGDFLALNGEGNRDTSPRVIEINCNCSNHNRCARCGDPLAASRLSAYSWDEVGRKVWYRAAYSAFSHRCPGRRTLGARPASAGRTMARVGRVDSVRSRSGQLGRPKRRPEILIPTPAFAGRARPAGKRASPVSDIALEAPVTQPMFMAVDLALLVARLGGDQADRGQSSSTTGTTTA